MSESRPPGMNPDLNLAKDAALAMNGESLGSADLDPHAVIAAREIAHQLYVDPKTELLKGDVFIRHVDDHIAQMKEGTKNRVVDGALTVYDLDDFKKANTTFGKDAVDKEVLGLLGEIFADVYRRDTDMKAYVSPDDQKALVSRLQGDEFAAGVFHTEDDVAKERRTHTAIDEADLQAMRVNAELAERLKGTRFESFGFRLSYASVQCHPWSKAADLKEQADQKAEEHKNRFKEGQSTTEDIEWLGDQKNAERVRSIGGRFPGWTDKHMPPDPQLPPVNHESN